MSKRTPFLFFIILIVSTMPLPRADALGIGPPSFELDLQMDGSNSTTVYLLSDGLEGELVIGTENLPFRVEPSKINMSKDDHYRPVELTFYGNETLEPGVYDGMVSFIAQAGGFVALGIKIKAKINFNLLSGVVESPSYTWMPETPDEEEESEEEETELETESEEEESEEEETESEDESLSEEDNDDDNESQKSIIPYIMIGIVGVGLAVLVLIAWWKRR